MAQMADHPAHGGSIDTDSHAGTYSTFLRFTAAAVIHVFFILTALVSFAFGHSAAVFLGFTGLIVGTLAILIDIRSGSRFFLSLALLVLFALITAMNVS